MKLIPELEAANEELKHNIALVIAAYAPLRREIFDAIDKLVTLTLSTTPAAKPDEALVEQMQEIMDKELGSDIPDHWLHSAAQACAAIVEPELKRMREENERLRKGHEDIVRHHEITLKGGTIFATPYFISKKALTQ